MDVTRPRVVLATLSGLLLAVAAGGAFDAVQWSVLVSVLIVGFAALITCHRPATQRVGSAIAAVVAGAIVAVLIAGGGWDAIASAVARGPRLLLTTEWPSPVLPSVVGAVALLVAAVTAVAADLAGRRHLHLAALVPVAIGWAAVLAIGAPIRPPIWIVVATGLVTVALGLLRFDRPSSRFTQYVVGDRTVALSAAAIALASIVTAGLVGWTDRADPRRTEDPEVSAVLIDPIEAMVALRQADPQFPLYEIADRSRLAGQSLPARWRIAALDNYDGQRWVPRLALRPIGGRLGLPSPVELDRSPPISYDLRFETDDLDLVPFPGPPLSIDVDVETDVDRVVVRTASPPTAGLTVGVESEVGLTSRSTLRTDVATRQIDETAARFNDQATRIAGDGTTTEQLRLIESEMRTEWELDSGSPGAGQQLALIDRFVNDTQRGTEEQFVTGFVMMARSLGYDARIATGFVVPPDEMRAPLLIDSSMASVWPEVRFVGAGWVAFDPVPSVESGDADDPTPPPEAQTPAAVQPPFSPPTDDADDDEDLTTDTDNSTSRWSRLGGLVARGAVLVTLGVLPFVALIATILVIKWRRRERRLNDPDPATRIRGAWANATDSLVDAGLSIAPSWTDDRIAAHSISLAPSAPDAIKRLAAMSTIATFATVPTSTARADDAIATSAAVDQAIVDERSRWNVIMWRLSIRSLRRATRSPVAP